MALWNGLALLVAAMAQNAAPAAHSWPAVVEQAATNKEVVALDAANGRKLPVMVWAVPHAKGVVVFGHGLGGSPDSYLALIEMLTKGRYSVVAPLEPDSRQSPGFEKVSLPQGFGYRAEDLMLARGYAAARFAGLPQVLAGHSYGSLFAMIGGGAVTPAGVLKGPPVAAVVAFSTPGKIQGIVSPDSFKAMSAPMLIVTGKADTVPGFVPNAADHRLAFETSAPGNKMLVTFAPGPHNLVAGCSTTAGQASAIALAFIDAYVSGNQRAIQGIRDRRSDSTITVETR